MLNTDPDASSQKVKWTTIPTDNDPYKEERASITFDSEYLSSDNS